jgi:chitin disaccharide deacetylase
MMTVDLIMGKLGFASGERLVLLHADDIGMCQSTVDAFADLFDFGLVTSGSVMVPCPHFKTAADWCKEHKDADVGVHLTLTSEWTNYRWRPISTRDASSGLLDEEGYFQRDVDALWSHAKPSEALTEVEAQIELTRSAGIEPTHLDCHMYACLHPAFVERYLGLAFEQRLPAFVLRDWKGWDAGVRRLVREWEEAGLPVFDHLRVLNLGAAHDDPVPLVKKVLSELPHGLSCVLLHPAKDTTELRAILPAWQSRVADYRAFMREELRDYIGDEGIHLVSYRLLRDVMRGEARGLLAAT